MSTPFLRYLFFTDTCLRPFADPLLSKVGCHRLHQHVDFVVCLGGDGTILHASSLFQRAIPPVVSFSAGSLGFLTNLSLQNVEDDLRAVIYGCEDLDQCSIEEEVRQRSLVFSCPHIFPPPWDVCEAAWVTSDH